MDLDVKFFIVSSDLESILGVYRRMAEDVRAAADSAFAGDDE